MGFHLAAGKAIKRLALTELRVVVGTPITERPPQLGRIEARTGLRMMPASPRSPYHSVRRVFPSTAGSWHFGRCLPMFRLGSSSLDRPHPPHSRTHRDFA